LLAGVEFDTSLLLKLKPFYCFIYKATVAPERIFNWGSHVRRKPPQEMFLVTLCFFGSANTNTCFDDRFRDG